MDDIIEDITTSDKNSFGLLSDLQNRSNIKILYITLVIIVILLLIWIITIVIMKDKNLNILDAMTNINIKGISDYYEQ